MIRWPSCGWNASNDDGEAGPNVSRAFKTDLLFNYASLAVLAVSGLLMNLVVVRLAGEAALGVFNQAYAVYIVSSQLAVGGVHLSALRAVAQAKSDPAEQAQAIASALLLSALFGVLAGGLVFATKRLWAGVLGSPEVEPALAFIAPALVLFSLNKTLIAALNGLEQMRVFAVLQALRFVALIAALVLLAYFGRSAAELCAAFSIAESVVALAAAPSLLRCVPLRRAHIHGSWLRRHVSFGARGLMSGVFVELNTRVDVLVIGHFWSDTDVGRYSLAAVFAEGLYQCLIVVKNQVNPTLARLSLLPDPAPILRLVQRAWRYLYPGTALVYLAGFGVLHLLVFHYFRMSAGHEVTACYLLVGAGIVVASGFVPFDGILLHSGHPGHYTLLALLVAVTNAALNLVFVPVFSIRGAALATGISVALSVVYLNLILRRQLRYSYLGGIRSTG